MTTCYSHESKHDLIYQIQCSPARFKYLELRFNFESTNPLLFKQLSHVKKWVPAVQLHHYILTAFVGVSQHRIFVLVLDQWSDQSNRSSVHAVFSHPLYMLDVTRYWYIIYINLSSGCERTCSLVITKDSVAPYYRI